MKISFYATIKDRIAIFRQKSHNSLIEKKLVIHTLFTHNASN